MNILHMKYALEVARVGSINKAAENLLVAQPNLSRAIKELEASLGITIFERTPKGMNLTVEGEQFISYAVKISDQIEQVEQFYQQGRKRKEKFYVSVPKSGYVHDAFLQLMREQPGFDTLDVIYNETASAQVVENILRHDYQLGIVRHSEEHGAYYKALLEEKGLAYQPITELIHGVVFSKNSPLAAFDEVPLSALQNLTEIVLGDPLMSSMPTNDARKQLPVDTLGGQIKTFDRGNQLALVKNLPGSFMWASACKRHWLEHEGLAQRPCAEYQKKYRDILIYRKDYSFTDLDRRFIQILNEMAEVYRHEGL